MAHGEAESIDSPRSAGMINLGRVKHYVMSKVAPEHARRYEAIFMACQKNGKIVSREAFIAILQTVLTDGYSAAEVPEQLQAIIGLTADCIGSEDAMRDDAIRAMGTADQSNAVNDLQEAVESDLLRILRTMQSSPHTTPQSSPSPPQN